MPCASAACHLDCMFAVYGYRNALLCCSQPANKYPGTFSASGIFGHFPFALPTIIAAFLSLVGEHTFATTLPL